ncbi:hypothetical protein Tco_1355128 [Tanacetum coccineum]
MVLYEHLLLPTLPFTPTLSPAKPYGEPMMRRYLREVFPTAPGYVIESDPEEDPEEYEDDETDDGPVDYPMDGGGDGDDDDGDSSRDDANDKDEDDDEEEEEEEEHLAPTDSTIVVPVDEPVFPPEGTEPVKPPPSTDITIGARISVRPQTSIFLLPEAEVERLLAMTTPSPSPPISLSPPSAGECLARISSTQALIDAVTVALPSPPLPSTFHYHQSHTINKPLVDQVGIEYGFCSTVELKRCDNWIRICLGTVLGILVDPQRAFQDSTLARRRGDSMDGGGGGLCFPRGLGSLDRIESGDSSGASDPSHNKTHHVQETRFSEDAVDRDSISFERLNRRRQTEGRDLSDH